MKIIFLGTNGWYPSPTGNTPCILVDSKDYYVIFDAGNGIYKLDQHITQPKSISLFISHFHIDHVSGLHCLNKFNFPQGIDVYVAQGRSQDFQTLANPPFTSPKQVRLKELHQGKHNIPFAVEVIEQFHTHRDHGYRVRLEEKLIVYSGDCGISKGSLPLAKNADLLIHECSYKADHAPDSWGHVGPIEAATLAKQANVKQLILTHFDASKYLTLEDRKEAEKVAQEIFPNTTCATDDMVIEILR